MSSLPNSFNLPCHTTFDPVIIVFSYNMSKPSQPECCTIIHVHIWLWICCVCAGIAAGHSELLNCLHSLMKEQYECLSKLASSTLSVTRLAQQITVIERHFIALARYKHSTKPDTVKYPHRKKMNLEANLSKQKRYYLY